MWTVAQGTVSLGSHAEIKQIGSGTVVVNPTRGDWNVKITLENIIHVPEAKACYFSVSVLLCKVGKIVFEGNEFVIYIQDQKIVQGYLENNLFWFDISKPNSACTQEQVYSFGDLASVHRAFILQHPYILS